MSIKRVLGSKRLAGMLILVFLLAPMVLLGDGATIQMHGVISPIKNESIKLDTELLKMKVKPDWGVKTKCWYLLENTSDSLGPLTIGFFIEESYPNDTTHEPIPEDIFASVDGEQVWPWRETVDYEWSTYAKADFAVWGMIFKPREKRMIYIEQGFEWNDVYDPTDNYLKYSDIRFSYELNLASLWAGVPQKMEIYLDFDTIYDNSDSLHRKSTQLIIKPKNFYWINNNTLCWIFENTDSIPNIALRIYKFRRNIGKEDFLDDWIQDKMYSEKGLTASWYKGNKELYKKEDMCCWHDVKIEKLKKIPNRYKAYKVLLTLYPAYLRNIIYAVHGYSFKSELWRSCFRKCKWYKPRDDFSESDFDEIERKNIQFILEHEKKIKEYLENLEKEEAANEGKLKK